MLIPTTAENSAAKTAPLRRGAPRPEYTATPSRTATSTAYEG